MRHRVLLNLFKENNQKTRALKIAQEIIDLPIKIPSPAVDTYKKMAKETLNK